MVTAGALVLVEYKEYKEVVDVDLEAWKAPPICLIVAGSAVFLIAFMGCCGVLRENNCMMMTVRKQHCLSILFENRSAIRKAKERLLIFMLSCLIDDERC